MSINFIFWANFIYLMEVRDSVKLVLAKISERDSLYERTYEHVPLADLIAVARLKTYRATTMLQKQNKEKLLDDLIDATAYLLFAITLLRKED